MAIIRSTELLSDNNQHYRGNTWFDTIHRIFDVVRNNQNHNQPVVIIPNDNHIIFFQLSDKLHEWFLENSIHYSLTWQNSEFKPMCLFDVMQAIWINIPDDEHFLLFVLTWQARL